MTPLPDKIFDSSLIENFRTTEKKQSLIQKKLKKS